MTGPRRFLIFVVVFIAATFWEASTVVAQQSPAQQVQHSSGQDEPYPKIGKGTPLVQGAGKALTPVRAQAATGPLRVNSANPRYFTDGSGKAIYLTGSHTWANLMDRGTLHPPQVPL